MYFLIFSVVFISILGTLSHFLYDISNHNKVIGLFTAVNESVWEHTKIALTPTLLFGLIDGFIYGNNPSYFFAKSLSLLSIIILMPLLYYSHKKLFKKETFILDIINFYIIIIVSQLIFYYILRIYPCSFIVRYLSCLTIFIIFGCYLLLTLMPIKLEIFKDPISKKYGFKGHSEIEKGGK